MSELADLKPSAVAVLRQLRTGPKTTKELGLTCGFRFGGRIGELRAAGCVIEVEHLSQASYRYTLTFEPGRGVLKERPAGAQPIGAYVEFRPWHPHQVRVTMNGPHGRFTIVKYVGDRDGKPDVQVAEDFVCWRFPDCFVEGVGIAHASQEAAA